MTLDELERQVGGGSPLVGALIARIRELKTALTETAKELGNQIGMQHMESLRVRGFAAETKAAEVVAAGLVLP